MTRKLSRPMNDWKQRPEILLGPNIPKPMHGVSPRVVMGNEWWNKTRRAAYKSTYYHCITCGGPKHKAKGKKWLEGHELYDVDYKLGRMTYLETVPLCNYCHCFLHDSRMLAMVQKQEFSQSKFLAVIRHGNEVLSKAGLSRPTHETREELIAGMMLDGSVAVWHRWRMAFDGMLFPPKFKSPEHWKAAMR